MLSSKVFRFRTGAKRKNADSKLRIWIRFSS